MEQQSHQTSATSNFSLDLAEQLEGHSPDDVLGAMQQASLVKGTVTAAIGTVVMLVALTVVPYAMGDKKVPKKGAKPVAAAAAKAPNADAKEETENNAQPAASADTKNGKPSEGTLKRLSIDEVKQSDPKSNPLESSLDDLLKDAK